MKKNWMKLFSLFLVTALFAVHLTACGGGGNKSEAPAESAAESTEESTAESAAASETEPAAGEKVTAEPDESVDDTDVEEIEEDNVSEPEEAESSEPEAPAEEDERGEYFKLSYFAMGDEEYTEDMLSIMDAGHMILKKDGTGEICIMEQVIEVTWDASTITAEGQSLPYDRSGDVIHIEQVDDEDGSVEILEFTKSDWPAEDTEEEGAEPASLDYDQSTRAGYYELESMSDSSDTVYTAEQLRAIGETQGLDMSFYLVFNEDGTGRFVVMGIDIPVTYDDDSLLIYGSPVYSYSYKEGRVTINYNDDSLVFAYAGTPDKAPAPEEAAEAGDAEDIENTLDSITEEVEGASEDSAA